MSLNGKHSKKKKALGIIVHKVHIRYIFVVLDDDEQRFSSANLATFHKTVSQMVNSIRLVNFPELFDLKTCP